MTSITKGAGNCEMRSRGLGLGRSGVDGGSLSLVDPDARGLCAARGWKRDKIRMRVLATQYVDILLRNRTPNTLSLGTSFIFQSVFLVFPGSISDVG